MNTLKHVPNFTAQPGRVSSTGRCSVLSFTFFCLSHSSFNVWCKGWTEWLSAFIVPTNLSLLLCIFRLSMRFPQKTLSGKTKNSHYFNTAPSLTSSASGHKAQFWNKYLIFYLFISITIYNRSLQYEFTTHTIEAPDK